MGSNLVNQLLIPKMAIETPIVAHALNGLSLAQVKFRSSPVKLVLAGNHQESLSFHIIDPPVVLGYPWLKLHNPQINWGKGEISAWSTPPVSSLL